MRSRLYALCAAAVLSGTALAQDPAYPTRPVRLIMPNAPGSSIDTVGRIVAARLGEHLGQQIVIENRAGASGAIGMELGKNAPPDGYTLTVASASNMGIAPLVQKSIPYDPLNDFAFVSTFVVMPNVLVVNPKLPVHSLQELIDYCRANPGRVNMASAGPGAASHLGGVLLMQMGKFESLHVPYKGGGPSMAAVMAGESHWSIAPAPAAMAAVKGGRLRAIAHSLPQRGGLFSDMPAVAETVPGYDYGGWAGLVAPKATPKPILDKVHLALAKTVAEPAVRRALANQGAEISIRSPEAFRKFVEEDLARNVVAVKAAGLRSD
jgi:tripartite-type tricarboxylate transporter receptor subunit TctC